MEAVNTITTRPKRKSKRLGMLDMRWPSPILRKVWRWSTVRKETGIRPTHIAIGMRQSYGIRYPHAFITQNPLRLDIGDSMQPMSPTLDYQDPDGHRFYDKTHPLHKNNRKWLLFLVFPFNVFKHDWTKWLWVRPTLCWPFSRSLASFFRLTLLAVFLRRWLSLNAVGCWFFHQELDSRWSD